MSTARPNKPGAESILIIEDEEMLLQLEKSIFERIGYTIFSAENGIDGYEMFRQLNSRIDLVILDMNLPKMDGAETLRRMKQMNPSVKVLLISGSELPRQTSENSIITSATAFIQKPFDIPQLTALVRTILDS
ncbi:MAG: response regulator [Candidatus Zhuqueibacterota bacterium]